MILIKESFLKIFRWRYFLIFVKKWQVYFILLKLFFFNFKIILSFFKQMLFLLLYWFPFSYVFAGEFYFQEFGNVETPIYTRLRHFFATVYGRCVRVILVNEIIFCFLIICANMKRWSILYSSNWVVERVILFYDMFAYVLSKFYV